MLVVHRSGDADALAAGLADVLATPAADPFAPEVVAVPAQGVERWLAQRLSARLGTGTADDAGDGVCANVAFPAPSELLLGAVTAAAPDLGEALGRWAPRRLMWPLLEVVDANLGQRWCAVLTHHLAVDDVDTGRRVRLARRLARLFDGYAQHRPAMLLAWAEGRDEFGDGTPLGEGRRWQAQLWRHLRDHVGTRSPVELFAEAAAALRAAPGLAGLPPRLSVFGANRLPRVQVELLAALAAGRDVHLWLHHASPALWQVVAASPPALRRADDPTAAALTNPLLASLSRDVREFQQVLTAHAAGFRDVPHPGADRPASLLGHLVSGLAGDTVPAAEQRPVIEDGDRSVQVHACHGRARQVEVLREVVVGLLADDPTLQPRDILVMCPDVEAFAPLLAARFGGVEEGGTGAHPATRLRVRIADRALTQSNPLAAVLPRLLELASSRVAATAVLDLAGHPCVRARFRLADDDVQRLREWVPAAGIRWGLDADHRGDWRLGGLADGTWRRGLDRLLLGAAVEGGTQPLAGLAPLDDVDSADLDLLGRLAELVDRLAAVAEALAGRHAVADWAQRLEAAVLSVAAAPDGSSWQQAELHRALEGLVADSGASEAPLCLAELRPLLDDALAGRPTRSGFRTGALTVCTLVPMRSVPHRVVCLLGLDDGAFPRTTLRDGDDLLAADPWVGDRDPRSEDRQLLLDAIGAARDRLVVTYTGADERTGAAVPPAVPLGELLDALDRCAATSDGTPVRDAVVVRHPLQPFDTLNFSPGELGRAGPFSFDPVAHSGAVAARGPRSAVPPLVAGPLPPPAAGDVALEDLLRLLEHPARGFLRQRLGVIAATREEEPQDTLDVELDSLQEWALGERLLAGRLAGLDPAACVALERGRGLLPPGALGPACLREVGRRVEPLVRASHAVRQEPPRTVDVDVPLPSGRVTGSVPGVRGDTLLSITYSRLGPRHRLRAWVQLLALAASQPGTAWRSVAIGRGRDGAAASEFGPLERDTAAHALAELVAVHREGLRAPLPVSIKTGAAYAERRRRGIRVPAAREDARRCWEGDRFPGEQTDPEHALVYGESAPLTALLEHQPLPGEGGPGWPEGEDDRFGLLARRIWTPLLQAERRVDL